MQNFRPSPTTTEEIKNDYGGYSFVNRNKDVKNVDDLVIPNLQSRDSNRDDISGNRGGKKSSSVITSGASYEPRMGAVGKSGPMQPRNASNTIQAGHYISEESKRAQN